MSQPYSELANLTPGTQSTQIVRPVIGPSTNNVQQNLVYNIGQASKKLLYTMLLVQGIFWQNSLFSLFCINY